MPPLWDPTTERVARLLTPQGPISIPLAAMARIVTALALTELCRNTDPRVNPKISPKVRNAPDRYLPLADLFGFREKANEALRDQVMMGLDDLQRWLCGSAGITLPKPDPPEDPTTVWDHLDDQ